MSNRNVLLSAKDAAEYLGLTAEILKNMRLKGGGPTFIVPEIGEGKGRPRYAVKDLDQWVESQPRYHNSFEAGFTRKNPDAGGAS